jgi:NAD(P)-dependent dehydrogenase (short-subunit alcohol dehydrogenase family)
MNAQALKDRVAVVTGARRGLGRAVALALGGAGAKLALVDVEPCDETLAEAKRHGVEAHAYHCDVSDPVQVEALGRAVIDHFETANILVNAAGIVIRRTVSELAPEEWTRVIAVNLTGPYLVCRAFIPHMRGQGYGRIINVCSVMAHISSPDRAAYSASKAGLLALTRSLALDLAPERITAIAISPGAFATEMTKALREDVVKNQRLMDATPLKRWGTPEEIGQLALYLCSEQAGYITGTDIVIDGGWLAG